MARLTADHAEAAGHAGIGVVRPFRQIGLAQDDGPGVAQPLHQEGIAVGLPILERVGAGRGVHRCGGRDIVLQQNRDAEQIAVRGAGSPLGIKLLGDRQRIGVQLDDGIQAVHVVLLDAIQVIEDHLLGGDGAFIQHLLELRQGLAGQGRVQRR